MDFLHIIILAIVEGITEFLPISSTAHLILTSHILGISQTEFLKTFEISIQVGSIAAVAVVFYKKILSNKPLFFKACVGFLPTGILGLIVYKHIKLLLSSSIVPVIALFVGGVAIILIEYIIRQKTRNKKQEKDTRNRSLKNLTYKQSLLIGLMQSVSMIPGVSRSAASIFGGMALGLDRQSAVEFSFLLAIPTMAAATALDLMKSAGNLTSDQTIALLSGTIISFVTALLVIKWLLKYVQTNNFIWFGVYRIVISVVYYLIFLRK